VEHHCEHAREHQSVHEHQALQRNCGYYPS
jgi:hypothetical protein